MSESFDLVGPVNFVAGAVGEPGERTFYLQANDETTLVSLKVEKGQVHALASGIAEVLGEPAADETPFVPTELIEPVSSAWTIGGLGIGVDEANDRLVVVANELNEESDEPATARFHLTHSQARGFMDHALLLVEYGRNFGRQNGHRPR